jgi:hypothetical protein
MTKSTFRVALFAAFILVTQTGPGGLPRVNVPSGVKVSPRGGRVPSRGGG